MPSLNVISKLNNNKINQPIYFVSVNYNHYKDSIELNRPDFCLSIEWLVYCPHNCTRILKIMLLFVGPVEFIANKSDSIEYAMPFTRLFGYISGSAATNNLTRVEGKKPCRSALELLSAMRSEALTCACEVFLIQWPTGIFFHEIF